MREEELARLSRALAEAESALAGTQFFLLFSGGGASAPVTRARGG